MDYRSVFVTVGTTSFDILISVINTQEIAEVLKLLGCKKLVIQFGRGNNYIRRDIALYPVIINVSPLFPGQEIPINHDLFTGINVDMYGLRNSIKEDIEAADLVIGHAGAGTCLEVLKAGKPLIVVINDSLMDNHQTELSRALTSQGIVVSCFVTDLVKTLTTFNAAKLKKLTPGHPELFGHELDRLLGYSTS